MKISEIQKHAEELCNRNKWHERDVSQRFLYLMSEIGELSNELIKLKWKDQDINKLKRNIGHEMFDVIWNICDLANLLDIDLEQYSKDKRDQNNNRTW